MELEHGSFMDQSNSESDDISEIDMNENSIGGRPRKNLKDLKGRTLRSRLADISQYINKYCQKEDVEMDYLVSMVAMKCKFPIFLTRNIRK